MKISVTIILAIAGIALLWVYGNWEIALGVFSLQWAADRAHVP